MSAYISVKAAAQKWGLSDRRVQVLCSENRIDGAFRLGNAWAIPADAKKPDDKRKTRKKG
ncbi:MAG TPA: DNA-binding protein [Clostridiaceae bacterium]|jgi:hypothetical protein|nr:DNA-binding protein [Thermacetogenium phaeum]HHW21339.1 DNA-binding protein [Clostridiaceae bacterium]